MSSRDFILNSVRAAQPATTPLPDLSGLETNTHNNQGMLLQAFTTVATAIGSKVVPVTGYEEVKTFINRHYLPAQRKVTTIPTLFAVAEDAAALGSATPHSLDDVELAILQAKFAVAENGALWLTEQQMAIRVLPFICQHLALVVHAASIVPHMHAAYNSNAMDKYGFGAFIAGPSKTADIEQSLVLGAHGARSLTIFVLPA